MDAAKPYKYNHVQIEITSRCNLRCRTCLYFHFEPQWVPQDLSKKVFKRICEIAPRCRSIHLQGWGESLLRKDCFTLIRQLKKLGPKISLGSNGMVMDQDMAQDLIQSGLDSMAFSIAGVSAVQQDPLRGKGTFARAIRSIQIFTNNRRLKKQPPVLINYLLTPGNLRLLPRAMSLCSRMGIDILHPTHMVHVAARYQEKLIAYNLKSAFRWPVFRSRLAVLWSDVSLSMPSLRENLVPVCEKNPVENLFIGADGSVSPCVYLTPPLTGVFPRLFKGREIPFSRLSMGNLNQDNMDDIWDRPDYRIFRKAFKDRIRIYQKLMTGITTGFDGLDRLTKTSGRLGHLFATRYPAPQPCRVCPHLYGL
ncbi:MAG: radical SAM/SPASM domain-containing protein [Thermodesulfobacteriota bacterium]|nr:radical SAM/SPASM domain-containing protein [Thermodesulfobacteriota bacterium]